MTIARTDSPEGRIAVVLGTRPEIIKLAGIIELLGPRAWVIHTGQHYDDALSASFFSELGLAPPAVHLGVGGQRRGAQVGHALEQIEALFHLRPPDAVIVQGDTNASLAGALAANVAEVPLVHVEAGLRSRDRAMPEEHNRVLIDHLADLCCAPTPANAANLAAESVSGEVVVTGNTVVEAVHRLLPPAAERRATLAEHGLLDGDYVVATVHRPENTDDPARLAAILRALHGCGRPVVVPLHPRTAAAVQHHGLSHLLEGLQVLDPLGGAAFLALAAHARLLVSDSGGVQEECTVLKRPLVVVRRSTERPESLQHFARVVEPAGLTGALAEILAAGPEGLEALADRPSPYGDGQASERIVGLLGALTGHAGVGAA